jgi:hypothetical protein
MKNPYDYPIGHFLNAKMSIARIFDSLREVGFVLDTKHQQNLYDLEAVIEQEICTMWNCTVNRAKNQNSILDKIRSASAKSKNTKAGARK